MSVLVEKVNAGVGQTSEGPVAPVMATPALAVAAALAAATASQKVIYVVK